MIQKTLSSFFSMNRAEEENIEDLWGKYVLPLNYKEYNLLHFEKSVHITGGRGIGKTAYLKYHCYPTILSSKKTTINDNELKRIGIYWKPDTELLSDMTKDVLEDEWDNAFNAYVGLSIFIELAKFLKTFIESPHESSISKEQVQNLLLPARLLKFLNIESNMPFIKFEDEGHYLRSELNDWLCDTSEKLPFKFKAKDKIILFVKIIQSIEIFKETKFCIFIDEFENLSQDHQKVINTWIKHVPENIIFHVAYKKHYEPEAYTVGNEKNQEINDYRVVNIEDDLFGEENFFLLASEIVLNKLQKFHQASYQELSIYEMDYLSKESFIEIRKSETYKNTIKMLMNNIFPDFSLKEIADILMRDSLLFNKLKDAIEKALKFKKSDFKVEYFINVDKSEESILNAILLHRKSINAKTLLEYFEKDLVKYSSWKNNNLFGAILFIYNKEIYNRRCPYYGGFEHFIMQSASNVRHLLELVHQSFVYAEKQNFHFDTLQNITIPTSLQAEVAREVSTREFDRKIAYLGKHGKKLKRITERIGKLFALAQNNPAQSFAEVNQFSILASSQDNLSEQEQEDLDFLLTELKMWSVFIEKNNTKKWDKTKHDSLKEYRLHPILSSYFGISFRQKRKYEFTNQELKIIFFGNDTEYAELYRSFSIKNNIDIAYEEQTMSLLDLIK